MLLETFDRKYQELRRFLSFICFSFTKKGKPYTFANHKVSSPDGWIRSRGPLWPWDTWRSQGDLAGQ